MRVPRAVQRGAVQRTAISTGLAMRLDPVFHSRGSNVTILYPPSWYRIQAPRAVYTQCFIWRHPNTYNYRLCLDYASPALILLEILLA